MALLSTWLNLEPSCMAQLCTYTRGPQGRNYASVNNILKYIEFALIISIETHKEVLN